MRLSASWLAFAALAASLSSLRCCSVRFWFCSIARCSASGLSASCGSSPAFASSSRSDCCRCASASIDSAIFSSAACAAAFSASLISPDSSFLASSASDSFAPAKSPFARLSENLLSSPSCFSRFERSLRSASAARPCSLWRTSSSRFCSCDMRRMASRRASPSGASPATSVSALRASPASDSRMSSGSAFDPSISCFTRSSASTVAFFSSIDASSAPVGSGIGHE